MSNRPIVDNEKTSKTGENPISGQSLKMKQYPYAIGGSAIGGEPPQYMEWHLSIRQQK